MDEKLTALLTKLKKAITNDKPLDYNDKACQIIDELDEEFPTDMETAIIELTHNAGGDRYEAIESRLISFAAGLKNAAKENYLYIPSKEILDFFNRYNENEKDPKIEEILNSLPLNYLDEVLANNRLTKDLKVNLNECGDITHLYKEDNPNIIISTSALATNFPREYLRLLMVKFKVNRLSDEEVCKEINKIYEESKEFYLVPTYVCYTAKLKEAIDGKSYDEEAYEISLNNTKKLLESGHIFRTVLNTDNLNDMSKSIIYTELVLDGASIYPLNYQKRFITDVNNGLVDSYIGFVVDWMKTPIIPIDDYSLHTSVEKVSYVRHDMDDLRDATTKALNIANKCIRDLAKLKEKLSYGEKTPLLKVTLNKSFEELMDPDPIDKKDYETFINSCNDIRFWYGIKLSFDPKTDNFYRENIDKFIEKAIKDLKSISKEKRFRVKEILAIINGKDCKSYKKQMKPKNYFAYMENHKELMANNRTYKKYKVPVVATFFKIIGTLIAIYLIAWVVCALLDEFAGLKFPEWVTKLWPWYKRYWEHQFLFFK